MKSVCLILIGCLACAFAEEDNAAAKPKEVALEKAIQPRAEGAVWRYRSVVYDGDEMIDVGIEQEKVVKIIELEGVKCYRIEYSWDYRTTVQRLTDVGGEEEIGSTYYWEYFNEQGSYHFEEDMDDPQPPAALADFELTIKYPATKGMKYEAGESPYEVLATKQKLKLGAGEFTCVVYQLIREDKEDPDYTTRERFYMAPGIGMVRWEVESQNEDGEWEVYTRNGLLNWSLTGEKKEADKK